MKRGNRVEIDYVQYWVFDDKVSITYELGEAINSPAKHSITIISMRHSGITPINGTLKGYSSEYWVGQYPDKCASCVTKLLTGGQEAVYLHLEELHKNVLKALEEEYGTWSIYQDVGENPSF